MLTLGDISTSRDTEASQAAPHRPREEGAWEGGEPLGRGLNGGAACAGGRDSKALSGASARVQGESPSQTGRAIPETDPPTGRRV